LWLSKTIQGAELQFVDSLTILSLKKHQAKSRSFQGIRLTEIVDLISCNSFPPKYF